MAKISEIKGKLVNMYNREKERRLSMLHYSQRVYLPVVEIHSIALGRAGRTFDRETEVYRRAVEGTCDAQSSHSRYVTRVYEVRVRRARARVACATAHEYSVRSRA